MCLHPMSAESCLIVIADGGDSITTFVPIYLMQTSSELTITICIFYILFALMLLLAYYTLKFPPIARFLTKFGIWIRPFLLIGLGIFILSESILFERGGDDDNE
jgi:cadmium resistance protein CadD (predicted permease)